MQSHPLGRSLRLSLDAWAIALLAAMGIPLYWDRLRHGRHLSRVDIVNQFLPNYAYLGERLKSGDIPGWLPSVFSGIPFAGDPQSGWMYIPAMVCFTLFPPEIALKANFLLHIWIAGFSTFALARITGLNWWGAMTSAIATEFGSLVEQLRSVNVLAQFTAWVPLALLGFEVAFRARSFRSRATGWTIGALAMSQMIVGWTGQGSAYAFLVVGTYCSLRSIFSISSRDSSVIGHIVRHATDCIAVLVFGLGLSAAGLWIRLDVNRDSVIAGGNYHRAFGASHSVKYLSAGAIVARLLTPSRNYYIGGATLGLAIISPFIARGQRWRVGLYVSYCLILSCLLLRQAHGLRTVIYILPRLKALHEHSISRELVLFSLPIALLAGVAVDGMSRSKRGWNQLLTIAFVPAIIAIALKDWLPRYGSKFDELPETSFVLITAGVALYAFISAISAYVPAALSLTARSVVLVMFIACVVHDPFGASFGEPLARRATVMPPEEVFDVYLSRDDPGGPGEFIQDRMASEGPFRFLGYGPSVITSKGPRAETTYHGRFRDKLIVELLFSRTVRLGLLSIQGYNPAQSARYSNFLNAVNGEPQNYHDANILRTGIRSPLLRLLHVRYIIVGRYDDQEFPEVKQLELEFATVFQDTTVRILEVDDALPHAWVLHNTTGVSRQQALAGIQRNGFDPSVNAFVEGTVPSLAPSIDPAAESVRVTHFEPDKEDLTATLNAPGIVVISEMYASGWKAYVDGEPAKIYATDYVLRGIAIPSGTHSIEMRYAPASIPRGIAISLGTLALLLTLILRPWKYRHLVIEHLKR
ncbi:MAG: YfhO family protein [Thermomicrobiales bacterium]